MPENASQHGRRDSSANVVAPPVLKGPARWLLAVFSLLCLILGLIGVVVPGMPTTVFVLLSAWAAARSSSRLHAWLMRHRVFGPMLLDWQEGGRVSRKSKRSATLMMGLCAFMLPWTPAPVWAVGVAAGSMGVVLIWLWRRPEPGQSGLTEEIRKEMPTKRAL